MHRRNRGAAYYEWVVGGFKRGLGASQSEAKPKAASGGAPAPAGSAAPAAAAPPARAAAPSDGIRFGFITQNDN